MLLAVHQQNIASASQDDRFRTEPPFKPQGSYGNRNKLAEKIAPALDDEELEAVITEHYVGEAQTLTAGAEANLLKLAEIRGTMTEEERTRWTAIKKEFRRLQVVGGSDEDPATRISSVLSGVVDHLEGGLGSAAEGVTTRDEAEDPTKHAILQTLANLQALSVGWRSRSRR